MTIFQTKKASLKGYRKGKEETLRDLYRHYINSLERFVSNGWYNPKTGTRTMGIRDFDTCAELIQEIFIRAFSEKARNSYDGIRPFQAFLFTIARNVIIDHMRKTPRDPIRHRWFAWDDDRFYFQWATPDESETEEESLDEVVYRRRCLSATQRFVSALDDTGKQLVQLRLGDELSQEEAAQFLGLSRSKIRTLEIRLHRELEAHLKNLALI